MQQLQKQLDLLTAQLDKLNAVQAQAVEDNENRIEMYTTEIKCIDDKYYFEIITEGKEIEGKLKYPQLFTVRKLKTKTEDTLDSYYVSATSEEKVKIVKQLIESKAPDNDIYTVQDGYVSSAYVFVKKELPTKYEPTIDEKELYTEKDYFICDNLVRICLGSKKVTGSLTYVLSKYRESSLTVDIPRVPDSPIIKVAKTQLKKPEPFDNTKVRFKS